ncbi:thiamine phosphate synthase [Phycicoccus sp. CSK15P-2]|uniref:thiamine phosphate synthase n=1 Tax=Phycicoccus sp. CSK15P-2 TaxID=2807627 RepID=UPI0027DB67FC|nr:thiamine phosphate synthase [Phycicoccus sp. CSK15P-2]
MTDSRLAAEAGHDLVDVVRDGVGNGVTAVQVREKYAPARVFLDTVLRIADVLPEPVTLVVNDRVDVFLAARAAGARVGGVHVGQQDLPPETVRELVGPDALLGLSAATENELRAAVESPALVDYVGVGTLRGTATKTDAPPPLGHAGMARVAGTCGLPVVAIGGVRQDDLPALRAAGVAGAAVASGLCSAPDVAAAARDLRTAWEAGA